MSKENYDIYNISIYGRNHVTGEEERKLNVDGFNKNSVIRRAIRERDLRDKYSSFGVQDSFYLYLGDEIYSKFGYDRLYLPIMARKIDDKTMKELFTGQMIYKHRGFGPVNYLTYTSEKKISKFEAIVVLKTLEVKLEEAWNEYRRNNAEKFFFFENRGMERYKGNLKLVYQEYISETREIVKWFYDEYYSIPNPEKDEPQYIKILKDKYNKMR